MKNFAELIEQERERLAKLTEDYTAQISDLQSKLAEIAKERRALDAYQSAKEGKPARTTRTQKGTRAPRGSKREEILALIKANRGIARADILDKLGAKGNKAVEGSISNALTSMKKAGTIALDGGKYTVV